MESLLNLVPALSSTAVGGMIALVLIKFTIPSMQRHGDRQLRRIIRAFRREMSARDEQMKARDEQFEKIVLRLEGIEKALHSVQKAIHHQDVPVESPQI